VTLTGAGLPWWVESAGALAIVKDLEALEIALVNSTQVF
jgi:hypothetical protein